MQQTKPCIEIRCFGSMGEAEIDMIQFSRSTGWHLLDPLTQHDMLTDLIDKLEQRRAKLWEQHNNGLAKPKKWGRYK